nr:Fructose dehydrogenase large subunit [Chlamydiota bacterium]
FGGSTMNWGSRCRPLDEIDFEKRNWIPYSGWPFKKSDLDAFYERAQKICQLGDYNYDPDYWIKSKDALLKLKDSRISHSVFQFAKSGKKDFGKLYRKDIKKASNIKTFLYSNVTQLVVDEYVNSIRYVQVTCLNGNTFHVNAKHFILATGGIENPRILLNSNIGNQNDLVGRFFMEHPGLWNGGILLLSHSFPKFSPKIYQQHPVKDHGLQTILQLTLETKIKSRLGNYFCCMGNFVTMKSSDFYYYSPERAIRRTHQVIAPFDKMVTKSNYVKNDAEYFHFWEEAEQIPNPESRVTLMDEKDALGMPRIKLNWKLSQIDINNFKRSRQIMAEAIAHSGLGRVKLEEPITFGWNKHHMGTTRMHENPKLGVVNSDCKVHNITNLYIAGSSVFPTGGASNPTLTIVALAIRLADHIKNRVVNHE